MKEKLSPHVRKLTRQDERSLEQLNRAVAHKEIKNAVERYRIDAGVQLQTAHQRFYNKKIKFEVRKK